MVFNEVLLDPKLSVLAKFCLVNDRNLLLHMNIADTQVLPFKRCISLCPKWFRKSPASQQYLLRVLRVISLEKILFILANYFLLVHGTK